MQFTRSKKIIGGLTLVGAMALSGDAGFAQQTQTPNQGETKRMERGHRGGGKGMRGGHSMFGRFGAQLNLTEAQKQQMQQISARYKESFKAMRGQGKAQRGGGGVDALTDGTFNEAAVRAAAQARANAHVEMEVARARMMSEMYAVLTAEQKAQITAARQQREQRRQQRRAQRQSNATQSL
ncbi:MAG: Spy/CpxP family protein refolding chaperone [Pyrinomonadaceae bacterium MAG19_C2-C3]|nr:Spy/CpxP family protein refolding chaperone [Pyrinomonadaceae bacterium MAG19_C2-C3]